MIDSENIFETTEETGYRVCSLSNRNLENMDSTAFSACWDINNISRLFVCQKNGFLRVIDMETRQSRLYDILFRRFVKAEHVNSEPVQLVSRHFDKFILIPNRPDEFIFLLGVSNRIYYSALPGYERNYPLSPFISQTTRNDYDEYIYGAPVLELWSHANRITCLGISHSGEVLASGDEEGRLKLLFMQQLDDLSVIVNRSATHSTKKVKSRLHFEDMSPNFKLTKKIHSGPIYALSFLPFRFSFQSVNRPDNVAISEIKNEEKDYQLLLASGSTDNVVHIWSIHFSTKTGMTRVDNLMSLRIMTSNILCLHSIAVDDVSLTPENNTLRALNTEIIKDSSISSSIVLAAGLHLGSIYVWRIPGEDLHQALTLNYARLHGSEVSEEEILKANILAAGSFTHSILQVSTLPVVSVTFSLENSFDMKTGTSRGRILLASSDIQSNIRIFFESNRSSIPQFNLENEEDHQSVERLPNYRFQYGPMLFLSHSQYPSAIVACVFHSREYLFLHVLSSVKEELERLHWEDSDEWNPKVQLKRVRKYQYFMILENIVLPGVLSTICKKFDYLLVVDLHGNMPLLDMGDSLDGHTISTSSKNNHLDASSLSDSSIENPRKSAESLSQISNQISPSIAPQNVGSNIDSMENMTSVVKEEMSFKIPHKSQTSEHWSVTPGVVDQNGSRDSSTIVSEALRSKEEYHSPVRSSVNRKVVSVATKQSTVSNVDPTVSESSSSMVGRISEPMDTVDPSSGLNTINADAKNSTTDEHEIFPRENPPLPSAKYYPTFNPTNSTHPSSPIKESIRPLNPLVSNSSTVVSSVLKEASIEQPSTQSKLKIGNQPKAPLSVTKSKISTNIISNSPKKHIGSSLEASSSTDRPPLATQFSSPSAHTIVELRERLRELEDRLDDDDVCAIVTLN